jgi:hypothetical protein
MGEQNRGQVGGRDHALAGEVGELPIVGLFQEPRAQRGDGHPPVRNGAVLRQVLPKATVVGRSGG